MHNDLLLVTLRIAVATNFRLKLHILLILHFIFDSLLTEYQLKLFQQQKKGGGAIL
jgi:hypothetical protein